MTRDEAMIKLLRLEPETRPSLVRVTGWPRDEVYEVLDRLVAQRKITYINAINCAESGRRYYVPAER